MQLKALRKVFLWTVIVLGGFYVLTIIYLVTNEENMIFFPAEEIIATPADKGWEYTEIEFGASDTSPIHGWKINGSIMADSLPVILFLHGNGGNISYNLSSVDVLRDLGRAVYIFDYRGYGKSGGKISANGFAEDCRSMLVYLLEHEKISGSDIIVHGHSLGAHGALQLAVGAGLRGLVMEGAFTSIPDVAAEIYRILPVKTIMSIEMNNLDKLIALSEPVFFIHAQKDRIIPVPHSETLYAAAKYPKELLILESGGHADALLLNRALVIEKYRKFFRY